MALIRSTSDVEIPLATKEDDAVLGKYPRSNAAKAGVSS